MSGPKHRSVGLHARFRAAGAAVVLGALPLLLGAAPAAPEAAPPIDDHAPAGLAGEAPAGLAGEAPAGLAGEAPAGLAGEAPAVEGQGEADRGADLGSVPALQQRLETAMAELGAMAQEAETDGDATRSACIKGWQQRGQDAMEVATSELLVIRDEGSTDLARSFAVEKLAATADRMEALVEKARKCSGDQSPEEEDDQARTEVDETKTIPLEDPTLGGGTSPILPPIDPNLPSTAASPAM